MTPMNCRVTRNFYHVKKDRWSMSRFHLIHTFLCKPGGYGDLGLVGSCLEMYTGKQNALWVPTYYLTPESSGHLLRNRVSHGWELYLWRRGEGAKMSATPACLKMQTASDREFIRIMKRGSPWKRQERATSQARIRQEQLLWKLLNIKAFNTPRPIIFIALSVSEY